MATPVVIADNEFALVVRMRYDGEPLVMPYYKSDRPEKQRAELLTCISAMVTYARAQGISIDINEGNGSVVVRG